MKPIELITFNTFSALGFDWQPSTHHPASLNSWQTVSAYNWLETLYCQGTPHKYTVTISSLCACLSISLCLCFLCVSAYPWSQTSDWSLIFYFFWLSGDPQEKNTLLFRHIHLFHSCTHTPLHIYTKFQIVWCQWLSCFGQELSRDTKVSVQVQFLALGGRGWGCHCFETLRKILISCAPVKLLCLSFNTAGCFS